jgi:hypothetical protein
MRGFWLAVFAVLAFSVVASAATVEVGTYVLNVGRFDLSEGSYVVDFYLWFNGNYTPNFEFTNGRADSIEQMVDDPDYKLYRVEAVLYKNIDLRDYPLDNHEITIELEDKVLTTGELDFVPDRGRSGLAKQLAIAGWNVDGWEQRVAGNDYPQWEETFSRYVYAIKISRPPSLFFGMLIPFLFTGFIGWIAFLISVRSFSERLEMSKWSLLTAVAYHIWLASSVPPVGYLMLADKLMYSLYFLLFTALVITVAAERLVQKGHAERAVRLNESWRVFSLVAAAAVFAVLYVVL